MSRTRSTCPRAATTCSRAAPSASRRTRLASRWCLQSDKIGQGLAAVNGDTGVIGDGFGHGGLIGGGAVPVPEASSGASPAPPSRRPVRNRMPPAAHQHEKRRRSMDPSPTGLPVSAPARSMMALWPFAIENMNRFVLPGRYRVVSHPGGPPIIGPPSNAAVLEPMHGSHQVRHRIGIEQRRPCPGSGHRGTARRHGPVDAYRLWSRPERSTVPLMTQPRESVAVSCPSPPMVMVIV